MQFSPINKNRINPKPKKVYLPFQKKNKMEVYLHYQGFGSSASFLSWDENLFSISKSLEKGLFSNKPMPLFSSLLSVATGSTRSLDTIFQVANTDFMYGDLIIIIK